MDEALLYLTLLLAVIAVILSVTAIIIALQNQK